jgi:murein DD-endopeptidase MepM/ murein hydrolase activator NlpD
LLSRRQSAKRPKCNSFTLMLIPGKYGSPKTLHIPRWIIKFTVYFNIAALIFIFIFFLNYKKLSSSYADYIQNNKELKIMNEGQQKELSELRNSTEEIRSKLEELKKLEEQLKSKLNLSSKSSGGPPVAYTDSLENLNEGIDKEIDSLNKLLNSADKKIAFINSKPSILPARGSITSYFGKRLNPFTGRGSEFHSGVDIANSTGTEVNASGNGVVIFVGWQSAYGNAVIIDHGYGYSSVYGHNSKLLVSKGERVIKGQAISLMGSTGRSTGPHVHFEIRLNGTPIDPLKLINGGI